MQGSDGGSLLPAPEAAGRYRGVFVAVPHGLLVLDATGRLVDANVAAIAATGLDPRAATGSPLCEVLGELSREGLDGFLEALRDDGGARMDLVHEDSTGRGRSLHLRGVPFAEQGEPRILVVVSDVTARRRTERRHAMLARKVLVAQEEERARISRELHDELGQLLTAVRYELGWVQRHLAAPSAEATRAFDSAVGLVERSAEELRHICKRLRPTVLDDLGLEPAVRQLIEDFAEWTGLDIEQEIALDEEAAPLPVEVTICAYRVVQEALTNVSRHSAAQRVAVRLVQRRAELVATVYDDGRGFDGAELHAIESTGMTGMRERANLVGGRLAIRSEPFQGTRVELVVPLASGLGLEVT
jgi:PAS domain S-box-containing protein